jgi:hypothetical protein
VSIFHAQKFLLNQEIIDKNSDLKYFYVKSLHLFNGSQKYVGIREIFHKRLNNSNEIAAKFQEEGSTNTRISIWMENIQKMKNYNINEMLFGSDFSTSLRYRHNFILDIFIELGLVGGLLVSYLILNFLINFFRHINKLSEKNLTWSFITLFMFGIHFFSLPYYNFKYLAFFSGIFYYSIFTYQKT